MGVKRILPIGNDDFRKLRENDLLGILVNSGYLTALKRIDSNTAVVKIPNDEVMSKFQVLIAEIN